jgi:hypothetical protein
LIDTIKSVEQNYKWIIYRLCFESYQNKNEIINTETADQNILDSDAAGLSVENEWNEFGFRLSANGGVGKKPHLFDTANPGTEQLGSPNERCDGGGPGIGEGGEPATLGANCNPLGTVVIIQERNKRLDIPTTTSRAERSILIYFSIQLCLQNWIA